MVDRIRQLLTTRQLSSTQFADTIGIGRPVASHILSGRNKPSLEVVQKIISAFPELSLPWLLNGNGPMLASAVTTAMLNATKESQTKPVVRRTRRSEHMTTRDELITPQAAATATSSLMADESEKSVSVSTETPAAIAATSVHSPSPDPEITNNKAIRRIIIFYQDGTFSDYQPEP